MIVHLFFFEYRLYRSEKGEQALISINYRDSRPIYEQIKDGLKHLMLAGAIKCDEKLPSVREMASRMSINPNTIQRAYRELEAEGYIYSISGRGSFASGRPELDEKKKTELEEKLKGIISQLVMLGVGKEEIVSFTDACIDIAGKTGINGERGVEQI